MFATRATAGGRAVGYSPSGSVRWTHLFDGDVHTIAVMAGVAYVGGHFDRACRATSTIHQLGCPVGYTSRVKLAALDGRGRLTGWNPRANGTVGVHALSRNPARRQIAAGGAFTTIGGVSRERFALFGWPTVWTARLTVRLEFGKPTTGSPAPLPKGHARARSETGSLTDRACR